METTVGELARKLGTSVAPEEEGVRLTGVGSVADAREGDLTFLGNRKYLPQLKSTRASAALVPEGFDQDVPPVCLRVPNPSAAFAEVLREVAPEPVAHAPGVHPTAVVETGAHVASTASVQPCAVVSAGARIGERTVVGAGTFIGPESVVGDDCILYQNVCIRERVRIGDRVIIHNGAVVGSDGYGFELHQGRHVKIPQIGTVQIDDDVEIGANTTIDRARFGRTWIQEGTKIDNLVQIAHNVVVGRHCLIVAQVGIAGSTKLGDYVTLAGQVGVSGHIELGDRVVAAAQSGIANDQAPDTQLFATPAVPMRDARRQIAALHRLPEMLSELRLLRRKVAELEGGDGD